MTAELVCQSANRDDWIKARRTGVTATDIVTILGLNPYGSEYALYWEKLGKLPPWEGSPRTRLGQELEDYAAGLWLDEHPEYSVTGDGELWRSAERPWQMATPDKRLHGVGLAIWEGKTWDDHDRAAWEDGVPPRVRAQVLWQMDTLGVGTGHVGVLFLPSGEFESRTVEHPNWVAPLAHEVPDERCRVCADVAYMRQVGEAFWVRVQEGLPPFPDGSPATLAAVKALHAGVCAGTVEVGEKAWEDYVEAREVLGVAKIEMRQAEAELRVLLGDAETGTVGGEPVVKRTRYQVAAKTIERKAYEVDKLTRLGARNGDSDE